MILLSLFFSLSAFGNSDFLSQIQCRESVSEWLTHVGSLNHWRRQVDPHPNAKSFRTGTKTFGTWIEAHVSESGQVEILQISNSLSETVSWDEKCLKNEIQTEKLKASKNSFTDKDLMTLMKKNKKGMIYIWSPGMVYSMDFYPDFKRVSEKLELPLTVLMDPYFDEEQGKQKAKEFKMPYMNRRVESVELLMRDIGTHYPETLIYSNGRLSDDRIVGVMTTDVLESEIRSQLKALE